MRYPRPLSKHKEIEDKKSQQCPQEKLPPPPQKKKEHTFRSALGSMRLHGNVRVQVVQCTICLFTAIPSTLVHTLDFLIPTTGSLVLLRTGNRNE